MIDSLGLEQQRGNYNCVFYLLSTIPRFSYFGEIAPFQFYNYGTEITVIFRRSFVRGYMKSVQEMKILKIGPRISDQDVMVYIS